MIYCQLQDRAQIGMGQPLCLCDVARSTAPASLTRLELPCPNQKGVWKLSALECAAALQKAAPQEEIFMLGAATCYVHRAPVRLHDPTKWLRTVAAFLILLMGGAMGLSWFHSDVDMPNAQMLVYHTLTGQEVNDPRLITIPYCIGVALGAGIFYALPSRKAASLLDVQLSEYQTSIEQAEGKEPPS